MRVTPIGPDPAKRVVRRRVRPAGGRVVRRKRLSRPRVLAFFAKLPRCWVGMEAGGGAPCRASGIGKLGHAVRLMPASCGRPP
jgi:transposase